MRNLQFQVIGVTKNSLRRLKPNRPVKGHFGLLSWVVLPIVALYLVDHLGGVGAQPFIKNPDFEDVAITTSDSQNPGDAPGWIHSGSPGDFLLERIESADSQARASRAGHGSQFVGLGGGVFSPGTASWTTTIYGLVPAACIA